MLAMTLAYDQSAILKSFWEQLGGEKQMNWVIKCEVMQEGNKYVSLCEDLSIASQGDTVEEAKSNLVEALEMFFEDASPLEVMESLARLDPTARPTIQRQSERQIGQQDNVDLLGLNLQVAYA